MQYQALYRRYRPQRFSEVVGQDHVVNTLAREIIDAKIAHAYLFAGPRGTGKTTSARLLAKSLNCTNLGADGEPCNECVSCVGITEGTSLDVIELDAASHNKVEDVREIRVNVGTVAAAAGARRVYILDEAHMLSRAAGNALLKTLEEPPEHVVFVLATTEPYKLLDTIRSRAQRFDFHPVSTETLVSYLEDIADREGFTARGAGLAMVASHARGSVRDALSLLEQVAALGGGTVDPGGVTRALGLADREAFGIIIEAISSQDAPTALGLVADLAARGADLRRFIAETLSFFRGIFLAQYAPNLEEVADEPPETLDEWRTYAKTVSSTDVLRSIDQLAEALVQLRQGREERLVVELTLLRLTRPETALDAGALASRLDRVERSVKEIASRDVGSESRVESRELRVESRESRVESPEPPTEVVGIDAARDSQPETRDREPGAMDAADPPPAQPPERLAGLTLEQFEAVWPAIVGRIRSDLGARRHAFVMVAAPVEVTDGVAMLEIPSHQHFHLEQLQADLELQKAISDVAAELLGGGVGLAFRSGADGGEPKEPDLPRQAPDKERLLEEGTTRDDPEHLIADMLGGEVIQD
jgi:DNA polymerase-3 subunit gamma/tau